MGINLHCTACNSKFTTANKKYRVMVKLPNGKRKSKVVNTLDLAKKVEAKFKTESVEKCVFNIQKSPLLSDIWTQYLTWAKTNKKSWTEDQGRWTHHVEPHLKSIKMDKVSPRDIEKVLERGFTLIEQNRKIVSRAKDYDSSKKTKIKFYDKEIQIT